MMGNKTTQPGTFKPGDRVRYTSKHHLDKLRTNQIYTVGVTGEWSDGVNSWVSIEGHGPYFTWRFEHYLPQKPYVVTGQPLRIAMDLHRHKKGDIVHVYDIYKVNGRWAILLREDQQVGETFDYLPGEFEGLIMVDDEPFPTVDFTVFFGQIPDIAINQRCAEWGPSEREFWQGAKEGFRDGPDQSSEYWKGYYWGTQHQRGHSGKSI